MFIEFSVTEGTGTKKSIVLNLNNISFIEDTDVHTTIYTLGGMIQLTNHHERNEFMLKYQTAKELINKKYKEE